MAIRSLGSQLLSYPYVMKFYPLALVCLAILHSCTDDVGIDPSDKHYIDIGTYELLEESLAMLPYYGKSKTVFVDSTESELVFEIRDLFPGLHTINVVLTNYDVFEDGDTVQYAYESERETFLLTNDSLTLTFKVDLTATPYSADPESRFVADVLEVWRSTTGSYPFRQVFLHVLNQRTWPQMSTVIEDVGTISIFNKTFSNVLVTNYSPFFESPRIYFNYEIGIVSFEYPEGNTWRFERFE